MENKSSERLETMASWGGGHNNTLSVLANLIDSGGICIKSMSAAMNKSGVVSISMEIMGTPDSVVSKLKQLPDTAALEQISQSGGSTQVTVVDYAQAIGHLRVMKSAIFKTVSQDVLTLYKTKVFTQDIVPASQLPEAAVYIKPSDDIYESQGWTVLDIIDTLELNVAIPSVYNYHITQFMVMAGTPIVSVIQSLIPIPGLIIRRIGDQIVVKTADDTPITVDGCVTSESSKLIRTLVSARGDQGELRYVRGESGAETADMMSGETKEEDNMTYITNKLGGIFGVTSITITSDQATLPTDLWTRIDPAKKVSENAGR